jgi:hypothetical protein
MCWRLSWPFSFFLHGCRYDTHNTYNSLYSSTCCQCHSTTIVLSSLEFSRADHAIILLNGDHRLTLHGFIDLRHSKSQRHLLQMARNSTTCILLLLLGVFFFPPTTSTTYWRKITGCLNNHDDDTSHAFSIDGCLTKCLELTTFTCCSVETMPYTSFAGSGSYSCSFSADVMADYPKCLALVLTSLTMSASTKVVHASFSDCRSNRQQPIYCT